MEKYHIFYHNVFDDMIFELNLTKEQLDKYIETNNLIDQEYIVILGEVIHK